jgi:glycosyltransferase involved in cell wall biosynthesis
MQNIKISTIIPNYNHGEFIENAIQGILNQSFEPFEVLVIDDGSTDDSVLKIKAIAKNNPKLKLVALPKNKGALNAVNFGINEIAGNFVHLAAADDFAPSDLYKKLVESLELYPNAAFVSGEAKVIDRETMEVSYRPAIRPSHRPRYIDSRATAKKLRNSDNWILTLSSLISVEKLRSEGGFDESLGAFCDGYLLRKMALQDGFIFVPNAYMEWRISADGQSRILMTDPVRSFRTLEYGVERMKSESVFPEWYIPIFRNRWKFGMARIAILSTDSQIDVLKTFLVSGRLSETILTKIFNQKTKLSRIFLLAWITMKFQPFSIRRILFTSISRKINLSFFNRTFPHWGSRS